MNLNHLSKQCAYGDSESLSFGGASILRVSRDPALTAYIGKLISGWLTKPKDDGSMPTAKDFAEYAEVSPSNVSQVLKGTLGVGTSTGKRFAKAFGKSFSQLVDEAETWWEAHGAETLSAVAKPPHDAWEARREGVADARALIAPPATDAEISRVFSAYGADLFRTKDRGWWTRTIFAEVNDLREREVRAKAEHRAARERSIAAAKDSRRNWATAGELKQEGRKLAETTKPKRKAKSRAKAG